MNRISRIFILVFIAACIPVISHGTRTDKFASHKLKQLYESLPLSAMPESDTIMLVPKIGVELVFNFNRKEQLSHAGISLFSLEIKHMLEDNICNFIERLFLELLLQHDNAGIRKKLNEYGVSLSCSGQKFGEGSFLSLAAVLKQMDSTTDFGLHTREKEADAIWNVNGKRLKMTFPLYRELIEGTDKKESDDEIYELLQMAVSENADTLKEEIPENIIQLPNGLYVSKGVTGQIQSLSSDRYYVKKYGRYEPLHSERYPEYSMNNLFLTFRNGGDKSLQISHRQYGHLTPEVKIPLNNFLACFKDGFLTTCHTAYNKDGDLESIVVLTHKTLNYIHILKARISAEELFRPGAVLKAEFYSNIPQHYIKTLLQ